MRRGRVASVPVEWWLCALAGLCASAAADAAHAAVLALKDDLGREVRLEHTPRRIVSLLPSLTETVCALDACDRLVATDRFSDWPAAVRGLPKVGDLEGAEIEMIVRLQPDLVLVSRTQRITDRLTGLGLRAFALGTESYGAIAHTVKTLGALLDVPDRAAALDRDIEREVDAVGREARLHRHGTTPSVYFEIDRTPYAAGPASFIGELLTRLGTDNILTPDLGPFPKINPEYVVRHDPAIMIVAAADAAHLAERPGWESLRAVREERICSFPQSVRDTIVRPGPRVAEGMRALAGCLDRVAP